MYEPYPPPFQVYPPFLAKTILYPLPSDSNFGRSYPSLKQVGAGGSIVGKGGHTSPFLDQSTFSKISPFLEIHDVPTFHRSIGKTKELNNSCNQFVYNFYPQSILILEECLQNW